MPTVTTFTLVRDDRAGNRVPVTCRAEAGEHRNAVTVGGRGVGHGGFLERRLTTLKGVLCIPSSAPSLGALLHEERTAADPRVRKRTWPGMRLVGATGLEPAVSCSQSRRASHYATPR